LITAFTLMRCTQTSKEQACNQVLERMKKFDQIKKITFVYGEYDIVVKTTTEDLKQLNQFVYNNLRKIPHITITTTLIVAKIPGSRKSLDETN
jgi:DNA-binding Lrp family transcriptional regulator